MLGQLRALSTRDPAGVLLAGCGASGNLHDSKALTPFKERRDRDWRALIRRRRNEVPQSAQQLLQALHERLYGHELFAPTDQLRWWTVVAVHPVRDQVRAKGEGGRPHGGIQVEYAIPMGGELVDRLGERGVIRELHHLRKALGSQGGQLAEMGRGATPLQVLEHIRHPVVAGVEPPIRGGIHRSDQPP